MGRPPSIVQGALIGGLVSGGVTASGLAGVAATTKYIVDSAAPGTTFGSNRAKNILRFGVPSIVSTAAVGAVVGAAIQVVRRTAYEPTPPARRKRRNLRAHQGLAKAGALKRM